MAYETFHFGQAIVIKVLFYRFWSYPVAFHILLAMFFTKSDQNLQNGDGKSYWKTNFINDLQTPNLNIANILFILISASMI